MAAILVFLLLQVVALVHIGWAMGMSWPAESRDKLVALVIGLPEGTSMPSAGLTVAVAVAISMVGLGALWGAGWFSLGVLDRYKSWLLLGAAAVFLVRGVLTYMPFGPLQASVEPFRTLDLRYFAPLCFALALGYLITYFSMANQG